MVNNMNTYKKTHLKILDALRGIGFLLVFIYHLSNNKNLVPDFMVYSLKLNPILFSDFGLHLFFVLSGYLHFKPFIESLFLI